MDVLVIAVLIGLIPAAIAKGKGRSFGLWWFYGAALFIVALPHALIMKPNNVAIEQQQIADGMKKCPHCAELIKPDAKVCRYCSRDVEVQSTQSVAAESVTAERTAESRPDKHVPGWLVLLVFSGVGFWIYNEATNGVSPSRSNTSSSNSSPISSSQFATTSPGLTGPRGNAVRSANQYLNVQGFSRKGLIEQLSSDYGDGYSVADATAAVDSLNVDWNKQAVRSAQQYLSIMGFSCNGLIEQLSSSAGDQYTVSEATYGARQAGAC